MFALLKEMVCINSGSHNKTGVDAVGRVVTDALAGCGLAVSVIEETWTATGCQRVSYTVLCTASARGGMDISVSERR